VFDQEFYEILHLLGKMALDGWDELFLGSPRDITQLKNVSVPLQSCQLQAHTCI
jgi:hypothetical protein